jgi:hypothetical protein
VRRILPETTNAHRAFRWTADRERWAADRTAADLARAGASALAHALTSRSGSGESDCEPGASIHGLSDSL